MVPRRFPCYLFNDSRFVRFLPFKTARRTSHPQRNLMNEESLKNGTHAAAVLPVGGPHRVHTGGRVDFRVRRFIMS